MDDQKRKPIPLPPENFIFREGQIIKKPKERTIMGVYSTKELCKEKILTKPNVVGVGVGYKEIKGQKTNYLGITVLVREKFPMNELMPIDLIPQMIDGVKTDVIQVGDIRALQARTDRWRPAPGGVSLGHFQITAGTLGCVVKDYNTGERLILSNNHVLADCNHASIGDPILQPGPVDGGNVNTDTIALLERFHPIDFGGTVPDPPDPPSPPPCRLASGIASLINIPARILGSSHRLEAVRTSPQAINVIDAAVARPLEDNLVLDEILDIGVIEGAILATLGMEVRKSGRTTGFTQGEVRVLHATVRVGYGSGRSALFEDQIVTTNMSAGGDSGSLLTAYSNLQSEELNYAVGLLFAGSNQSTIHNPIHAVLNQLDIEF